jgi:uncharacterized protein (DUF362 family)
MTRFTRRDFLKIGASAAGSAAMAELLAACGTSSEPLPTAPSEPPAVAAPVTTNTIGAPTAPTAIPTTPPGVPDLTVVRGGTPEDLTRRAIEALGGMSAFVAKGAAVVIKPNICVAYHGYEYAATTNPWVVGTLVRMCFEAGAGTVKVLDLPFGGTQQEAYRISGIQAEVEAAGGSMVKMPGFKFVTTPIPGAARLGQTDVFEDVLTADTLINVPIAKTHGLSRLTLGMKNLMGVVLDRPGLHPHLDQNLSDLASLLRPELTVVDAVRILMANGPSGGNLADVQQLDTVIATRDIVAADSFGATLFGLRPNDLGFVVEGAARGLGRSDLQNLRIEEIRAS